jgi:predicted transposase/invertase (TIGR01784 family)
MKKEIFAPMTFDVTFKRAFTKRRSKRALLFLLNNCLKKVLKKPLTDVKVVQNVEPGETNGSKVAVFDMQCEDASGARFIVEVQVGRQKNFIKRTFFYLCRAVSNIVEKGKTEVDGKKVDYDYNIPVVYTLSFLDFDVDFGKGCDEFVQYLSLSNDLHPEIRYDMMHMVYILLPRFNKAENNCQNALDRLVFTFKNAHTLKEKPKSFKDKELEDIFESAKISKFNSEELMDLERRRKYDSDYANALETARDDGREEGRQENRQEILAEVFTLLRKGYSIDEVEKKLSLNQKRKKARP